uniref:Retinoic acid receptor responder protein 2 n=1 Tax=Seriola lalandi dorsalis TaxID=1841481 RepID=A0A3B4YSF5_SERLL
MFCPGKQHRVGVSLHCHTTPIVTDTGVKMAALLLLLLSVGALFFSSNAQEAYNRLPETYKKGVDLALEKLNSHAGIQHHFLFFRSVSKSDIESGFDVSYIYHHFLLKATKCPKGTVDSTACKFRTDRPLVDCAVCYKMFGGEIEQLPKPYIHCIHRPALTEEMNVERINHCNRMGYSSGAPTLLASMGSQ